MRRMLVVGCGGTGGAVLAYMMDQLRSDLARYDIPSIPECWQFVNIDVPITPEDGQHGLGSVAAQGGTYISCGPYTPSYPLVDDAVAAKLVAGNDVVGQIASWAPPHPNRVDVAVTAGAGQMRAIGRMLTLSNVGKVHEALSEAWTKMSTAKATEAMTKAVQQAPHLGTAQPGATPVIFVVSSMAGGSGASMALDVCRILTEIPGVDPLLMGVFMASADVFDTLPESARKGVRPNALAMFGEIVASQTGAAMPHDSAMLRALGVPGGSATLMPFARVFPVGRYVGSDQVLFGDGTMSAVYRGLGRALAALMESGSATESLVAYDFTNPNPVATDTSIFGWGSEIPSKLQWGALGYATLSMGRDRYAEYAAQRLSRAAVDRLLDGHLQAENKAGGADQARALVESQWDHVLTEIGLPPRIGAGSEKDFQQWVLQGLVTQQEVLTAAREVVRGHLAPELPVAQDGVPAPQFVSVLRAKLGHSRARVGGAAQRSVYVWGCGWAEQMADRFEKAVGDALATHGAAYTTALLERLRAHLSEGVAGDLDRLAETGPQDPVAVPQSVNPLIDGLKGVLANSQAVVDQLLVGYDRQIAAYLRAEQCRLVAGLLRSFVIGVVDPMRDSIVEMQRVLEQARGNAASHDGLARLATDAYTAWPSDAEHEVGARWKAADNEVLLTPAASFKQQYESDLPLSLPGSDDGSLLTFSEGVKLATRQVIKGVWATTGAARPPNDLIERLASWRPQELPTHPETGEPTPPARARYDMHIRPGELLQRARLYVQRPEESFRRFTDVSLRDYAEASAPESEKAQRRADLARSFRTTLSMALPLAGLDDKTVATLHGEPVSYRYKFSEIPFRGSPVADEFVRVIRDNPRIDGAIPAQLESDGAMTDRSSIYRIDVFGSYKNYSPLVYSGVLRPIADQWIKTFSPNEREAFWHSRRSRPLVAALPLTEAERRAMVIGWFLGQIVGRLRLPAAPYDEPVTIWDAENAAWVAFPHPLLTPPSVFRAKSDWLPAVLESVLLAMARVGDNPVGSSLRPYRVLRELFDSAPAPTNHHNGMSTLNGRTVLERWLATAEVPPGGASRVKDAGVTRAERAATAVEWLDKGASKVSTVFATNPVRSRDEASSAPFLRDLAEDVGWAADTLKSWLAEGEIDDDSDVF